MKKFLAGIAAAAIITVPMTSFALESMSKGALKKATGQAGVSIAVDNVVIAQTLPTVTYWDTDGYILGTNFDGTGTTTNYGVGLAGISIGYTGSGPHKLITLNAITDNTFGGSKYSNDTIKTNFNNVDAGVFDQATDYIDATTKEVLQAKGDAANEEKFVTRITPLTIDIGTCKSLSDGLTYNKKVFTSAAVYSTAYAAAMATAGTTAAQADTAAQAAVAGYTYTKYAVVGVVIGLPTVEIGITENANAMKVIKVKGAEATGVTLANAELPETTVTQYDNEIIAIQQEGTKKIAILGGRVEISAH